MDGLSPMTRQLVQELFPREPEEAAKMLAEQCGRNLPFCQNKDEYQLERFRFAALKISQGLLAKLQKAVDVAKRDELVRAGFAESLSAHTEWALEILGQK